MTRIADDKKFEVVIFRPVWAWVSRLADLAARDTEPVWAAAAALSVDGEKVWGVGVVVHPENGVGRAKLVWIALADCDWVTDRLAEFAASRSRRHNNQAISRLISAIRAAAKAKH